MVKREQARKQLKPSAVGENSGDKGKGELGGTVSDSPIERRPEEQLTPLACIVALLVVLLTAGCGGVNQAQPSKAPETGATPGGAAAVEPGGRPTTLPSSHPTGKSVTKTASPTAKASAKLPASPAHTEPLGKKVSAAPAAEKQQASAPLDLASLETRLKETKAIGLFTKIALKNQVDDLLNEFRAYYQGSLKTTLAQLRQRYDLLLLKVLSLLQDSDQSLATAVGASREAIWGILADPKKFAAI